MLKNLSEDSFSLQHCRMRLFVCSVAVLLSSYCLMFSKTSKVTRLNTEFPCVGDDHERMCDEAKRTCVHWSHWCDGNYDCANKADEDVTSCSHESSLFNEFAIDNEPPGLQAGVCLPNKQNHEEEGSCVLDDYPLDCTCHKGTWLTCNNIGLTAVPTHIRPSEILTKLVLRNNEITRIPTNAFSVYPNLTLIDLTGNKIHTVEPNAFAGLSLLKGLFLQNNQLDALPNGTFSTTTNLAQLYLSYNKFTDWNPDLFAGVRCLNQLYMIGSHIRLASDGLFQHLNTLRYLELAHNDIAEIKENTFNGLSLLKLLNLSDNAIHFISSTAFQKLKLSDLSLSRNKLSFLYPTTFADQQKLSDLDLSHNPLLNNLPEKWLYGMDNLVKL
ncbi:hypothetical protein RvY_00248-2 [Ramazzottius varieornatus]|uniref:LRRNT domain-containing protein n=1 Tax=Ramazzottius varieornatus TaxID=947166 RepID=A0A1D1UMK7_RAMVA|nr:hypothetical protein RvY_00248-2 [Ramazzottius varieornatus]